MARKKLEPRNPLADMQRETVVPTPLRPVAAEEALQASQHAGMPSSMATPTSGDKKYTTYLRASSIKAIKRYAFDHEVPATELVQEAMDVYLKGRGAPTDL